MGNIVNDNINAVKVFTLFIIFSLCKMDVRCVLPTLVLYRLMYLHVNRGLKVKKPTFSKNIKYALRACVKLVNVI